MNNQQQQQQQWMMNQPQMQQFIPVAAPFQGTGNNNRGGPRGGRNNRSWRQRGKGRIPPTNVDGPRMTPSSDPIPAGQYLSKTSSPLTNDPLAEKAYFPGPSEEFRAIVGRQKIYPGCTVLPELMEQSYTKIASHNPSFGKVVPRSAYDYYVAVLTYYRLLVLHQKSGGEIEMSELNFISQLENSSYTVPKSISLFLSGMGNAKAPKSRDLSFGLIKPSLIPGIVRLPNDNGDINMPGYFGPIIQNLGLYSSYPCLAVYAQAIVMDLYRSAHREHPASWDLPDGVAYEEHPINHNCLGYQFARPLPPEQAQFYENVGVNLARMEFENEGLPLNIDLMNGVHIKLTDSRIPLHPVATISMGSTGQLPVEKIVSQSTLTTLKATWSAKTAFEMPSSEGWLGSSYLYNVDKTSTELSVLKSMMPVRYGANENVPIASRESLNILFSNTADFIKSKLYGVIDFSPAQRLEQIVLHDNPS